MEGTAKSPSFWDWTPIRSLADVANFSASRSNEKGFGNREQVVHPRKKNAGSDRPHCRLPPAQQGRRSDVRTEMDTQDPPQHCPTTADTGYRHQRQHGRPLVKRYGVLFARKSKDAGIRQKEPA